MYHNLHTKYYYLKHIIRIYTLGPIRIFHLFKMLGYEEGKKKRQRNLQTDANICTAKFAITGNDACMSVWLTVMRQLL